MTDTHRYNHFVIFALILIVGLGFGLALPWLANAQGLVAQNELGVNAPEATMYYVAITGTGSPGTSWTDAFTNVQDALAVAVNPAEIWVAKGVYYPDVGDGQINDSVTATFLMTDGVSIFGGFEFNDMDISDRDWENNKTVLSGDVDGDDTHTDGVVLTTTDIVDDNAYHVVTGSGVTITAVLDGFTITAGDAHGSSLNSNGGGMYSENGSPALTNVVFSGNYANSDGGGMYNYDSSSPALTNVAFSGNYANSDGGGMCNEESSSPALTDVLFSGNSAEDDGGGMYNGDNSSPALTNVIFSGNSADYGGGMYNEYSSSPTLTNVSFSGNSAEDDGGGMYNYDSNSLALTNVTFSGNSAGNRGGGMYNEDSSPTLTNVTFSGNYADFSGGGMYNYNSSTDVRNSILWNNQADGVTGTITATIYNLTATITLSYSLVEDSGGSGSWALDPTSYVDGGGNIDEDPLFILPINPSTAPNTTGNLRLQTGSPAIDTGDNTFVIGVPTDLDGEARLKDGDGDGTATVDMGAYEAATLYLLAVRKAGTGEGLVTSSPAGIDCGDTCSVLLKEDSTITLMVIPDEGSIFTGWSGACSGTADCVVQMVAAKTVTATFTLDTHYYYLPILIK